MPLLPRFDLRSHLQECCFNVFCTLGTCFYEGNLEAGCIISASLGCNCAFASKVALVPYDEPVYTLTGITVNLLHPLLHVVERGCVCDVTSRRKGEKVVVRRGQRDKD
eukprot:TRINITY_DN1942_c0_g1_i7.p1 TRINITY_DN1942_c0_g1~~TRINITY_DN1942_c0_g1_i7.p1  ORF type:complete len:108 (+),score=5.16 TRINITY_DN1942_c0_g1_i7:184-507(+)